MCVAGGLRSFTAFRITARRFRITARRFSMAAVPLFSGLYFLSYVPQPHDLRLNKDGITYQIRLKNNRTVKVGFLPIFLSY